MTEERELCYIVSVQQVQTCTCVVRYPRRERLTLERRPKNVTGIRTKLFSLELKLGSRH